MASKIERRKDAGELELRAADGAARGPMIHGLAVAWDRLSQPLWRDHRTGKPVYERFTRGAFASALASSSLDVVALRDHDESRLLGRTSSGTLQIRETERGLEYDLELPDTEDGRTVRTLVERRDLKGSSFAFTIGDEEWEERDDAIVRTIRSVAGLFDVSPVTRPAYLDSRVDLAEARSLEAAQQSLEAWRETPAWREHYRRGMAKLAAADL